MSKHVASLSDDELWKLAHKTAGTQSINFDVTTIPEILATALTVELVQDLIDYSGVEHLLGPDLPHGLEYSDCVRAFKLIESWLCAKALSEIYQEFPGGSPQKSTDERETTLQELLNNHRELLNHISRVFWDKSQSNYAAALRSLRAHPEVFDTAP